LPNDPNGGTIGTAQYNTWRTYYGQPAASGTSLSKYSQITVPEVAIPVLFLMGILKVSHLGDVKLIE
jgi:hypothetical protein